MLTFGLTCFQPYGLFLMPVASVVLLGIWAWHRRLDEEAPEPRTARRFIVGFTLEELTLTPVLIFGLMGHPFAFRPGGEAAYLTGVALIGASVRPGWVPEWVFPLRGRWLRLLLAVGAVVLLFYAGPWVEFMQLFARWMPDLTLFVGIVWVDLALYSSTLVRALVERADLNRAASDEH
jgi:hypothetical protein